jgi:adenine phosphoribosyltransferase
LRDAPTKAELRSAIRWVDGHADVWRLFADAELLDRSVRALVAPFVDDGITHICAVESRGFILGGAAATALGAGFVGLRKAVGHLPGHVLQQETEPDYKGVRNLLRLQADVLPAGSRVLVVDDWLETGSQLRAARALLKRAGATVAAVSVIVDETSSGPLPAMGRFSALISAQDLSQ